MSLGSHLLIPSVYPIMSCSSLFGDVPQIFDIDLTSLSLHLSALSGFVLWPTLEYGNDHFLLFWPSGIGVCWNTHVYLQLVYAIWGRALANFGARRGSFNGKLYGSLRSYSSYFELLRV